MIPEVHVSTVASPTRFDFPDMVRPICSSVKRLSMGLKSSNPLSEPEPEIPAPYHIPRPIYVVSDLHLGDRGPRDNFTHMDGGKRAAEFWIFLNMVERNKGRLIIVGDLFELWQSNMSLVLISWYLLLDRLTAMKATYVLGNHDADLLHFCSESLYGLSHPFFKTMATSHTEYLSGKRFRFIHGHEADSYCAGSTPGIGRITAIYTGLKEDRNGGPFLNKHRMVEAATIGRLEWMSSIIRWFLRKPNRTQQGYIGLRKFLDSCDVVVSGHTHRAGQLYTKEKLLPIYNAGTWAESTCSFVLINPDGKVGVFDWVDGRSIPNATKLKVK